MTRLSLSRSSFFPPLSFHHHFSTVLLVTAFSSAVFPSASFSLSPLSYLRFPFHLFYNHIYFKTYYYFYIVTFPSLSSLQAFVFRIFFTNFSITTFYQSLIPCLLLLSSYFLSLSFQNHFFFAFLPLYLLSALFFPAPFLSPFQHFPICIFNSSPLLHLFPFIPFHHHNSST